MSKVIKAIFVAAMLVGLPQVSMAAENTDNNLAALGEIRAQTTLAEAQISLLEKQQTLVDLRLGKSRETDLQPKAEFYPTANPYGGAPPMNMPPTAIATIGQVPIESLSVYHDEVLRVVGVDDIYTATIRTKEGIYTVAKGDKISDGKVKTISIDKVVLIKDGKSVSLPFADQKS